MTTVEPMKIDIITEDQFAESLKIVNKLKDDLKDYITANFGERCDPCIEGDVPCGCCEAWKAYDTLFGWEYDE